MTQVKGYIHSNESFGTVDGPGIRYVLFMQGCPLRCLYCHNPDTWGSGGKEITVQEVMQQYERNKYFYKKGGITVTGGEPLLQLDFLIELFRTAKKKNIHTCIDTSGAVFNSENKQLIDKFDELMQFTDLVILDIKHMDSEKHKILTGKTNENILQFAKYLNKKNITMWISHVIVPGYTDDERELKSLGEFIAPLKNVKGLNVLPYHNMGKVKYEKLDIDYKLKDIPPVSNEKAQWAKGIILGAMREERKKLVNS